MTIPERVRWGRASQVTGSLYKTETPKWRLFLTSSLTVSWGLDARAAQSAASLARMEARFSLALAVGARLVCSACE